MIRLVRKQQYAKQKLSTLSRCWVLLTFCLISFNRMQQCYV